MAQLRHDYGAFQAMGGEIVAVGPEEPDDFKRYWEKEKMPFPGLADPRHVAAELYGQQVSLLKLGRMPALFIVDRDGIVQYAHRAASMADIPPNREILQILRALEEKH
jgi:peroxiredoxin Q/BCP